MIHDYKTPWLQAMNCEYLCIVLRSSRYTGYPFLEKLGKVRDIAWWVRKSWKSQEILMECRKVIKLRVCTVSKRFPKECGKIISKFLFWNFWKGVSKIRSKVCRKQEWMKLRIWTIVSKCENFHVATGLIGDPHVLIFTCISIVFPVYLPLIIRSSHDKFRQLW